MADVHPFKEIISWNYLKSKSSNNIFNKIKRVVFHDTLLQMTYTYVTSMPIPIIATAVAASRTRGIRGEHFILQ